MTRRGANSHLLPTVSSCFMMLHRSIGRMRLYSSVQFSSHSASAAAALPRAEPSSEDVVSVSDSCSGGHITTMAPAEQEESHCLQQQKRNLYGCHSCRFWTERTARVTRQVKPQSGRYVCATCHCLQ